MILRFSLSSTLFSSIVAGRRDEKPIGEMKGEFPVIPCARVGQRIF
jgi:hypothetical protein